LRCINAPLSGYVRFNAVRCVDHIDPLRDAKQGVKVMSRLRVYPVALFLLALVGATGLLVAAGLSEPVLAPVSLKQSGEPVGVCLHVSKTLVCSGILPT
jgi:hypothetical protein